MRPIIHATAEDDLLRQIEWYAQGGLPHIARRFHAAVMDAIDKLAAMPAAGPPKQTGNPRLDGLRMWPIKGFAEFWVYYLETPEQVTVIRLLHSKRDIGTVLDETF